MINSDLFHPEDEAELCSRAMIFRDKLIEEFRVEETAGFDSKSAPRFSTDDLIDGTNDQSFQNFLLKTPQDLVKFKIFKRSLEDAQFKKIYIDKRRVRVKNINAVPVGLWASWVSNHPYFTFLIFFLIIGNAVIEGLQTLLKEDEDYQAFQVLAVLDDIALNIFILEIGLKWVDNFKRFWWKNGNVDYWNVFDFVVTVLSAVPRIISIFASQNGDSSFSSLSNQLRLFRTLRLLKMVARSARLRVVISTVFEAFHSLGFILLLLLLLTYMFGIFAINVFYQYTYSLQDDLQYQHKFKDLSNAFITLFQLLTLDQWYAIQQDIQRIVSPTLVISFFIFWVWIAAFIFRNVFVGVMVAKFDEMNQKLRRDLEEAHKEKERQRKLKTLSKAMEKEKKAEEEANRKALRAKRKAARESAKAEKKEMERLQKLQQEREVEEKKRNDDSKNDNDNNNQTAGNGDGDGNDQNVHTMKNRESIMPLSAPIDDDGSNTHTINESGTISAGSTATSKPKVIKSHTSTKAGFLSPKPELSYRQLRPSIIGRHRHMLSTIDTVTMSSIGDSAGIDSGNGARSSLAKSSGGGEMNSNIMGASILTTMTALSSAATENTAVGASSETGYSYTTSNTTSNLTATTTTTASKRARRQGINTGDANTKGISVENLLNTRQPGVAAKLKLDAQMIEARQKMMREAKSIRKRAQQERIELMVWRDTLNRTLDPLSKEQSEHVWPRDVLFRYLMAMEKLQNNNKEFQDLQYLAAIGIHQLYEKETRNDLG